MINNNQIDDFLSALATKIEHKKILPASMRTMCICLENLQEQFEAPLTEALISARCCWFDQKCDWEKMETHRVSCWEYVDSFGSSTSLVERKVILARALICVLYKRDDDFSYEDTLRFFVQLLNMLGNYSEVFSQASQAALLDL
jgi:hypothetical protein